MIAANKIAHAKEQVKNAIHDLSAVLVDECDGYAYLSESQVNDLNDCLKTLIQIKKQIGTNDDILVQRASKAVQP